MASPETLRYVAYAALNVMVARELNTVVTEPYMDEPFHIPQAQAYCNGDWGVWDPKITTPPGLYLLSVAFKKIFLFKCTVGVLRFSNVLISLALPPLISRLLARLRRDRPPESILEPTTESLVISFFPVAWFFSFLYYTESGSVLLVLVTLLASLESRHALAALLGLLSCTFRQTNIIWVAFAMAFGALAQLHRPSFGPTRTPSPLYDPPSRSVNIFDIIRSFVSIPHAVFSIKGILPPYIAVVAAFGAFVVWNGGIVLGDKSNHIPQLHIPQLYYFIAFSTMLGLPVLLTGPGGPTYLIKEVIRQMGGTRTRLVVSGILTAVIAVTVHLFTIHHPFLLSDNRHYTFYVWARVFRRHPLINDALAPGYLACFYAWYIRLYCPPSTPSSPRSQTVAMNGNGTAVPNGGGGPSVPATRPTPQREELPSTASFLHALVLPLCLLPTLLPTPLLEPRYFLIPYLLLRLQAAVNVPFSLSGARGEKSWMDWGLLAEAVWYGAINWATMWVFLYAPREGVGRFMW